MTEIIEGGGPGSFYISKADLPREEDRDWDAADVVLTVDAYTGESKYSVAQIEVHAVDYGRRPGIGIYVEMTLDEAITLVTELHRIIFAKVKAQGYLDE